MKTQTKVKKILLTGGHAATTALSVVEELKLDKETEWDISWIGPKRAFSHASHSPFELELFPKLGVKVYGITAGKIQSKFTRYTIPTILKIPLGFFQSFTLLRKLKPDIVLSFGGFVSLPVVFAAWIYKIPVAIQEQIAEAGLANKVTSHFATKVFVARETSIPFFPKGKTELIGLPLTQEIQAIKEKTKISNPPLILVTGGSRGAQRVNNLIFDCLSDLLPNYKIIHQVGTLDFKLAKDIRSKLPKTLQKNYEVFDFIQPKQMSSIYEKTDILIGRAGANTVTEAMAINIPSIFIPIPWSIGDEQTKNANYAKKKGIAEVLPESSMSRESLIQIIERFRKNWEKIKSSSREMEISDRTATKKLLLGLYKLLK